MKDIASVLLPVSRTNTWFVRTYLWLYLLSPMINLAIKNSSIEKRFLFIGILFIISNYSGIVGDDVTLLQGRNIITFTFYYMLGNILYELKEKWYKRDIKKLLMVWFFINLIVISLYSIFGADGMRYEVFSFGFMRYNSPFLWINAIMTFMLLSHIRVQSKFINRIAKSCLAIYIIHCSFISWRAIGPVCELIINTLNSISLVFIAVMFLALLVCVVCILIYLALTPIWLLSDRFAAFAQNKADMIWSKVENRVSLFTNNLDK